MPKQINMFLSRREKIKLIKSRVQTTSCGDAIVTYYLCPFCDTVYLEPEEACDCCTNKIRRVI